MKREYESADRFISVRQRQITAKYILRKPSTEKHLQKINRVIRSVCVCVCCTANCMLTNLFIFWHYVYLHSVFALVHIVNTLCIGRDATVYIHTMYLYAVCMNLSWAGSPWIHNFSKWIRIGKCFPKKKKKNSSVKVKRIETHNQ